MFNISRTPAALFLLENPPDQSSFYVAATALYSNTYHSAPHVTGAPHASAPAPAHRVYVMVQVNYHEVQQ